MKLLIKANCVANGGKVVERGTYYHSNDEKEIYTLISTGRAVQEDDEDVPEILAEVEAEKKVKKGSKSSAPETAPASAPTGAPALKK